METRTCVFHAHLLVDHLLSVVRIDPRYAVFIYRIALYLSSSIYVGSSTLASTPLASVCDYVMSPPARSPLEGTSVFMCEERPHEGVAGLLHLVCAVEFSLLPDRRKPLHSLLPLLVLRPF